MAITNAQQYQQLVNKPANGKRPGYRGDDAARAEKARNKEAKAAGKQTTSTRANPDTGKDPDDRSSDLQKYNQKVAKGTQLPPQLQKPINLTPREIRRIKQRNNFFNIPKGKTGGVGALNLLFGPMLTENAIKTRKFFSDPNFTGTFGNRRSVLDAGKFTYDGQRMNQETFNALSPDEQEEVYSDYISRRQSGEIDAAGNPMAFSTGGIDAKSAGAERGDIMALPLVQDKVIDEEEKDPTAYRFLADGGRAAFQEGGGIFPRLNQLGSNVSSAEQELAALSQKINSAESTLGEGGGDEGGLGSIMPEDNNFTNPTLEAFSGPETLQATTGGGLLNNFAPGIDPMGSRKENPTGPLMQLGNSAPSTNLPGSGAPQAGDVVYDPTGMPNIFAPRNGYADGGMSEYEGGIMDLESGRQQYFLGKLVKKAGKAIKKIAKSPIGKAALLAGGAGLFGYGPAKGLFASGRGLGFKNFLTKSFLGKEVSGGNPSGRGRTGGILNFVKDNPLMSIFAGSALAGGLTPEDEESKYANVYDDFELKFPKNQYAFAAEGGRIGLKEGNLDNDPEYKGWKRIYSMSPDAAESHPKHKEYETYLKSQSNQKAEGGEIEPVAKKTMPLLDMDGKEMDLRAEGGFVPLGRMEKADDVPARLSKNEFVFTADAVRNAGEGDVDKGAEVMYNMMKNLEAGGEVSQESQGLDGAREMFQTSQRLEEVI